jgi:hypothetical protein
MWLANNYITTKKESGYWLPDDSAEVDGALLLAEVEAARVNVVRNAAASYVREARTAGGPGIDFINHA